jgi:hypothetical protein
VPVVVTTRRILPCRSRAICASQDRGSGLPKGYTGRADRNALLRCGGVVERQFSVRRLEAGLSKRGAAIGQVDAFLTSATAKNRSMDPITGPPPPRSASPSWPVAPRQVGPRRKIQVSTPAVRTGVVQQRLTDTLRHRTRHLHESLPPDSTVALGRRPWTARGVTTRARRVHCSAATGSVTVTSGRSADVTTRSRATTTRSA